MTPAQKDAIERLWPRYGVDFEPAPANLDALFGRRARRVLEIGFGDGESLLAQAAAHPDADFIGIEVHLPGVGHCLLRAEALGLDNLRVVCHDAVLVLERQIPPRSIDRVNLYFPDPWPKKRHHKRRLVTAGFLGLVATRLADGGSLRIATDWDDYAEQIDDAVAACGAYAVHTRREHRGDRPLDRPGTRFERRAMGLGHVIRDWRLDLAASPRGTACARGIGVL